MKIYTKTGDKGQTGLYDGSRTRKDSLRIEACGAVDELNSFLAAAKEQVPYKDVRSELVEIQKDLFVLGSDVATPLKSKTAPKRTPRIGPAYIKKLEARIDEIQAQLPKQSHFFLPGGCQASSAVEICRSVSRRAERRLWALSRKEPLNPDTLIYLNRLSDFLYVLARLLNKHWGVPETAWVPGK